MKMEIADLPNGLVQVKLDGRLDTPGVAGIELKLTGHTVARSARTIVDLSGVEFVGSMGIRMFITLARSLSAKGGILVLSAPQPLVNEVFETSSLHEILPILPDAAAAAAAALRG
jgi:anti-sigma B factor antagonist